MPSSTVENYVKTIYLQQVGAPSESLLPMGKLAAAMRVAPGTATSMVKTLKRAGLVHYEPRDGVRLTSAGTDLALQVLRRHRLVELFLVELLGLDWSEVHEEAEQLEHVISDRVLERIDALLGRPRQDPHGDPIPTAGGALPRVELTSLADCCAGQPVEVARIKDQRPEFLTYVEGVGLVPGARVELVAHDSIADSVTVQPTNQPPVTLGLAAAEKILVLAG